jgi:hypothetical protein
VGGIVRKSMGVIILFVQRGWGDVELSGVGVAGNSIGHVLAAEMGVLSVSLRCDFIARRNNLEYAILLHHPQDLHVKLLRRHHARKQ